MPAKRARVSNHMRIRVREPDEDLWLPVATIGGKRVIVKSSDKRGSRLGHTLDIGRTKAEKEASGHRQVHGLWAVRGVPVESGLRAGDVVKTGDWKTQSMRVEYSSIRTSSKATATTRINALKRSKKWKDLKAFLIKEYGGRADDIDVVPKGNDFHIVLLQSNNAKLPEGKTSRRVKAMLDAATMTSASDNRTRIIRNLMTDEKWGETPGLYNDVEFFFIGEGGETIEDRQLSEFTEPDRFMLVDGEVDFKKPVFDRFDFVESFVKMLWAAGTDDTTTVECHFLDEHGDLIGDQIVISVDE